MVTKRDGRFAPLRTRVDDKVMVRMRDGAYPALFAASPYQVETDDLPHSPLFLWREVGPVEWYVSRSYAYVHVDARGSGNSGGSYYDFMTWWYKVGTDTIHHGPAHPSRLLLPVVPKGDPV